MNADRPAAERLEETRATLRQVEGVLEEFGARDADALAEMDALIDGLQGRPVGLRQLIALLVRTYAEIMDVIDSLRRSRDLLEQAAMERLQSTHQKLAEVSSATEMAATGMLDGLDRALALLDEMDADDGAGGPEDRGRERREALREELHQLMNLLQFQDITSQQLGYASNVLRDIEERMVRLAEVFDVRGLELGEERTRAEPEAVPPAPGANEVEHAGACDPGASTFDAESRQALADEIFTPPGG